MATPKVLALRAIVRTTDHFTRALRGFPSDRWRDAPGGEAKSLLDILQHLADCEPWWLLNIGVPEEERPPEPDLRACESADEALRLFRQARRRLRAILAKKPDEFFEQRFPSRYYGRLHSGAELCLYIAEHDFYHTGQIETLKMLFV